MGTRGLVGKIEGESTARVTYCHWDQYPDHAVPALLALVSNLETWERAVDYLLAKPQGWSSINGSGKPKNMRELPMSGDWREARQFDQHYAEDEGDMTATVNLRTGQILPSDMGAEWLYLLGPDGIATFKVGGIGMFGLSAGAEFFAVLPVIPYDAHPESGDEPAFLYWGEGSYADLSEMTTRGYDEAHAKRDPAA